MTQRKLVDLAEDLESDVEWGFGSISCMETISYCIRPVSIGTTTSFPELNEMFLIFDFSLNFLRSSNVSSIAVGYPR